MDFASKGYLAVALFPFLLMACSEPPGEEVFVPSDEFSVSLEIVVERKLSLAKRS